MPVEGSSVPWTAIAALGVSIISLARTAIIDRRAKAERKASAFDADYGNAVRDGLRSFEKSLGTLRAFALPSGRDADASRTEMKEMRISWIAAADDLTRLLGEVDQAVDLQSPWWQDAFSQHAQDAEAILSDIDAHSNHSADQLIAIATAAKATYDGGLADIRVRLVEQRKFYTEIKFVDLVKSIWRL